MVAITDQEFAQFQKFIFESAGITLSPAKKALVSGRLARRLDLNHSASYGEYFRLLSSGKVPQEVQMAIDLLTTNETYFFREPKHFALLRDLAQEAHDKNRALRVWSAASSTGEETYSIAMVLADTLGDGPWEVLGTDISTRVLERARSGHYPMERASQMPPHYLKRYCLKGQGSEAGTLLIERALRQRVQFQHLNLNAPLPRLGSFDVIFLRNVMIYFSNDTKRRVVSRLVGELKSGGHLLVGHSETLNDVSSQVLPVMPSVYRKP